MQSCTAFRPLGRGVGTEARQAELANPGSTKFPCGPPTAQGSGVESRPTPAAANPSAFVCPLGSPLPHSAGRGGHAAGGRGGEPQAAGKRVRSPRVPWSPEALAEERRQGRRGAVTSWGKGLVHLRSARGVCADSQELPGCTPCPATVPFCPARLPLPRVCRLPNKPSGDAEILRGRRSKTKLFFAGGRVPEFCSSPNHENTAQTRTLS